MQSRRMWFVILVLALCFLSTLWGCDGGDSGGNGNESRFAGPYSGTFSGDDSGTFTVVIDTDGNITGSGDSAAVGLIQIEGLVQSDGSVEFAAGTTTTGARFSGTITEDGDVSGIWVDADAGASGTFSGSRDGGEDIPNIVGIYTGTGSETNTNCDDPDDNGTFSLPVTVEISSQDGMVFSGTFAAQGTIQSVNVRGSATLDDGLINADGEVSGTYTADLFIGDVFDSSSAGTFSGTLTGDTLNLSYSGMDVLGDSCDSSGSITVTR